MEYLWAFIIGGTFCVIGQILMDATKLTPPRILVLFVVAGALLTGLGIYQPLVELAGTGATVPLPGFGYALAKGSIEGAAKGDIIDILSGGIKETASGIATAVAFGYLTALIFNPKSIR